MENFPLQKKSSQLLEDWSRTMHDVVSLMRTSKEALAEMFDRFTVAEWIEQKLYPMYRYLTTITIKIIYIKTITIITILNILNPSS